MARRPTITFLLMDPPRENARSATAMRVLDAAARRGYNINVYAHEGAVCFPSATQRQGLEPEHGASADPTDHPLPREWVAAVMQRTADNGGALNWVNCGQCCYERGVLEAVKGVRRGSPADFWAMVLASDNTLVFPAR